MTELTCGHKGAEFGAMACLHLPARDAAIVQYVRWLAGVGVAIELLCTECAGRREHGENVEIRAICARCLDSLVGEDGNGDLIATRGQAEIRERPVPIDVTLHELSLPPIAGGFLDIAPVSDEPAVWIVLGADGTLFQLNADSGESETLGAVDLLDEPDHKPWSNHPLIRHLHVSSRGDFAAVVNDYGRLGAVYDLSTMRRTLLLDNSNYHSNTVPFSFAFVDHGGHTVAIHRTDWNRLDVSDATAGRLLAERGLTSRPAGGFHGRLIVSPDGTRILNDGWEWHPVGAPSIWDIRALLASNRWDSEDGPTRFYLDIRNHYWNQAMCWLDSDRAAIGGIGYSDRVNNYAEIFDGARIYAADEPKRVLMEFPGPAGTFFSDGLRLFSADQEGLSVWDVGTGARTARIAGFRPTRQHPGSRDLVEISGRVLRRWRY